ncbi:hypothetical protein [Saccharopolyspora hattusasensis]|uniref:hypothetical protein n=1 Tax=Saccharopolyspora hattusasensis TaxID=1128679 RepID=UPI003D989296
MVMPAVLAFDNSADDPLAVPDADTAERSAAVNALRHSHRLDQAFLQRVLDGLRRL